MPLLEYLEDLVAKASIPDPRTRKWFLIQSIWTTVAIVAVYLILVLGGQRLMKSREPFQLKHAMMVYNFCLVFFNAFIFYEFLMSAWLNFNVSKLCAPVETISPASDRLAAACWYFFISKSVELMDTVFFMLRKKDSQITFLHLYHHSTMPLLWYIGVKYSPGGEAYFSASINSGIHILMYTYYLLSAMGPRMQRYLWWKRYMTVMQLIQFWAILFHTSYALYADCGFPNLYNWSLIFYDFSHLALFSNFYYQTYSNKARIARHKKQLAASAVHKNGIISNDRAVVHENAFVANGIGSCSDHRNNVKLD